MTSRRTLRIAIRPSSAMWRTIFTNSLRRSSVSCGITSRMMLPSLDGVRPRFASVMPRSIAFSDDLSNGCTVSICASAALIVASCFSGVDAP